MKYRRARQEGLIREIGMEPSTDVAGRNGDKLSRIYELRVATDVVGGSRSGSRPVGTGYAQCGFESPPACKLPPITPAVAWPSPDSAS